MEYNYCICIDIINIIIKSMITCNLTHVKIVLWDCFCSGYEKKSWLLILATLRGKKLVFHPANYLLLWLFLVKDLTFKMMVEYRYGDCQVILISMFSLVVLLNEPGLLHPFRHKSNLHPWPLQLWRFVGVWRGCCCSEWCGIQNTAQWLPFD